MRRGFTFAFLLCIPALCFADTIYLKSGRQIECEKAWEEGKEVRYTISNGTVGIPKSIVAKIVKGEPKKSGAEASTQSKPQVSTQTASVDQEAMNSIESEILSDPSVKAHAAKVYTSSGIAALRNKDLAGALENFQKAYSYEKSRSTTMNLALIYFMLKDDFNAELYLNEELKLNPKDTEALNYLGEVAWRNEKLQDAEDYWQHSLAIQPNSEIQAKLKSLKKEKGASNAYENSTSRHFLIKYDGGTAEPNLVREINEHLEDEYQQLSNQFDSYPSSPFIVVLYPQKDYFHVTDAPLWSAGANDGKIKLPVRGISTLNDDLRSVLTHELTHSFVNYKTSDNCPTWLQEGLAQYSEGKHVSADEEQVLRQLIESNQLPSFVRLSGGFSSANSDTARVLYVMSLSFTDYLLERYPSYLMNSVLDELGKGSNFVAAFEETYSVPLQRVEEQWRHQLAEK